MNIERIGVNQIKFTLTDMDLRERDIKLTELAYGTEKTQALFREMMDRANSECGFEAENTPLLIEAVPLAIDSIAIIVTKVSSASEIEEKFSMLPRPKDSTKYKPKGLLESSVEKNKNRVVDNILIFSFHNLDDVTNAAIRLKDVFNGASELIKVEDKFFLLLENNSQDSRISNEELDAVLGEFGQRHISSVISKHYLVEHGEIMVKSAAIDMLSLI